MVKMLSDPRYTESNNGYCWFELMQIYDKISDCIYFFNKIYAKQIFLMFNEWLITTLLTICRSISPTYKSTHKVRTDLYFYAFSNIRSLLLTGISERLIQERRKTQLLLEHILIYNDLDPDYRSQVKTMLALVHTRQLQLSAVVCSVNFPIMITFAARIVSYTVLMIQNFYMKLLLKN
ncbi:uncharacterized protein LOC123657778 [Melitaea cinxia]|uniref:uncharacterized protein LOC123657778 n=1 Tax=Melitaea cinxia TaxID=113334 RepID=UPI001E274745|nr:uncharacterized protein LOC123657778 [Melitaea cinxia]